MSHASTQSAGGGGHTGEPSVRIPYADHAVTVFTDEVFGRDEAVEIFYRYFQTASVGGQYSLRELDLGTAGG